MKKWLKRIMAGCCSLIFFFIVFVAAFLEYFPFSCGELWSRESSPSLDLDAIVTREYTGSEDWYYYNLYLIRAGSQECPCSHRILKTKNDYSDINPVWHGNRLSIDLPPSEVENPKRFYFDCPVPFIPLGCNIVSIVFR